MREIKASWVALALVILIAILDLQLHSTRTISTPKTMNPQTQEDAESWGEWWKSVNEQRASLQKQVAAEPDAEKRAKLERSLEAFEVWVRNNSWLANQ